MKKFLIGALMTFTIFSGATVAECHYDNHNDNNNGVYCDRHGCRR